MQKMLTNGQTKTPIVGGVITNADIQANKTHCEAHILVSVIDLQAGFQASQGESKGVFMESREPWPPMGNDYKFFIIFL